MTDARGAIPDQLAYQSKFQWLTRLGFFSRGLLYILIGVLALRTGRTEDLTGALEYVGRGSGAFLLAVIAAGMAVYALWRFADAAFGIENPGSDGKALRKRAGAAVIGAIYLYLAWKALSVLTVGSSGDSSAKQQADSVLDLPGGQVVLGFAALVLAWAGISQLLKAASCSFLGRLDERAQAPLVKWLGRIGYAVRGLIFLVVAWLIGRAAIDGNSNEVGGMEQALDFFSGPMLFAVAGGLVLFGTFSIIEAIYRRIHEPPVAEIKREVANKIS